MARSASQVQAVGANREGDTPGVPVARTKEKPQEERHPDPEEVLALAPPGEVAKRAPEKAAKAASPEEGSQEKGPMKGQGRDQSPRGARDPKENRVGMDSVKCAKNDPGRDLRRFAVNVGSILARRGAAGDPVGRGAWSVTGP